MPMAWGSCLRARPGANDPRRPRALSPRDNGLALLNKKFSKNRMSSRDPGNREWRAGRHGKKSVWHGPRLFCNW